MKIVQAVLAMLTLTVCRALAQDATVPASSGVQPNPQSPSPTSLMQPAAALNWQELYERAEFAAQQWEAKDKQLEQQVVDQMRQLDDKARDEAKKEKVEPLPPAPATSEKPAANASLDYQALFWKSDTRGKAWRSRAFVLDVRVRGLQDLLSKQRIRQAGTPGLAYPSSGYSSTGGSSYSGSSSSSAAVSGSSAPKTVHVSGYTRSDGTYVAPYTRSAPGSRK